MMSDVSLNDKGEGDDEHRSLLNSIDCGISNNGRVD